MPPAEERFDPITGRWINDPLPDPARAWVNPAGDAPVTTGYGANMPKQPRSRWAIPLVVLTALWGLVLIVMTAFLIAMSLNGQPFSPSALIAGAAVAFGAFTYTASPRRRSGAHMGVTAAPRKGIPQ
ncbi:hypothetical protein SAMN05428934_10916 [Tessaracoccus flavus]|nr:hypothetical protein SAMN05428934_10916 [Tessaracoccus flavus]